MSAWSPLDFVESHGYRLEWSFGAALVYALEGGGWGLVVASYDWPLHRLYPAPWGVGVTPRPGLRLGGVMAVREPGRLAVVGEAAAAPRPGGAFEALPAGGRLDEWGLLDPYPPEAPPARPVLEAALQARPRLLVLLPAHTRPHSALALNRLSPQPAVILDACREGEPLAARAWGMAPRWLRLACLEAEDAPGLPAVEPAEDPGEVAERLGELLRGPG